MKTKSVFVPVSLLEELRHEMGLRMEACPSDGTGNDPDDATYRHYQRLHDKLMTLINGAKPQHGEWIGGDFYAYDECIGEGCACGRKS